MGFKIPSRTARPDHALSWIRCPGGKPASVDRNRCICITKRYSLPKIGATVMRAMLGVLVCRLLAPLGAPGLCASRKLCSDATGASSAAKINPCAPLPNVTELARSFRSRSSSDRRCDAARRRGLGACRYAQAAFASRRRCVRSVEKWKSCGMVAIRRADRFFKAWRDRRWGNGGLRHTREVDEGNTHQQCFVRLSIYKNSTLGGLL